MEKVTVNLTVATKAPPAELLNTTPSAIVHTTRVCGAKFVSRGKKIDTYGAYNTIQLNYASVPANNYLKSRPHARKYSQCMETWHEASTSG